MEDGVHSPCGRKLEFVGGWRENLFNFKRSLVFGSEFSKGVMKV